MDTPQDQHRLGVAGLVEGGSVSVMNRVLSQTISYCQIYTTSHASTRFLPRVLIVTSYKFEGV